MVGTMEDVMSIESLADWLEQTAKDNIERAYDILGAKPGPGIDIEVVPAAKLVSHMWVLMPKTRAGRAFVTKFWANPRLESNMQLSAFKRQCDDWGLKYKVMVKYEVIR